MPDSRQQPPVHGLRGDFPHPHTQVPIIAGGEHHLLIIRGSRPRMAPEVDAPFVAFHFAAVPEMDEGQTSAETLQMPPQPGVLTARDIARTRLLPGKPPSGSIRPPQTQLVRHAELVVEVPRAPRNVIRRIRHMLLEPRDRRLPQSVCMGPVHIAAAMDKFASLDDVRLMEMLPAEIDLTPIVGNLGHKSLEVRDGTFMEHHVVLEHEISREFVRGGILGDPQMGLEAPPRPAACLKICRSPAAVAGNAPHPGQLVSAGEAEILQMAGQAPAPAGILRQTDHEDCSEMPFQGRRLHDF